MALPSSGQISASDINVELGRAWNHYFDINGAAERNLAGKSSGSINFSDFYGKSNIIREPPTGDLWDAGHGFHYISFYGSYELYWNNATIIDLASGRPPTSIVRGTWTYYRGSDKGYSNYAAYRVGKY